MSFGRYSDDALEDSLFRDDERRMQEELEAEMEQSEKDNADMHKSGLLAIVIMFGLMIGFLIWFFIA